MGINDAFESLAHSGIYLSIGALLVAFPTYAMLQLPINFVMPILFFFGAFAFYTANRYFELAEDLTTYPERSRFINSRRKILFSLAVVSFGLTLFLSALGGLYPILLVAFASVFVLVYSTNALKIRLKNVLLLKNVSIALSWAFIFTFMPVFFSKIEYGSAIVMPFLAMFTLTLVNTTLFDIRDVVGDKKNGILTIPIRLGIKKTILCLKIVLVISLFYMLVVVLNSPYVPQFVIIILPTFVYLYVVTSLVGRLNMRIIADLLGDGWLVVYGIIGLLYLLLINQI